VLGVFGLLLINAKTVSNHVRENFAITVLLKNDAQEIAVKQFQKSLELTEYVKTTEYVSKEEAATQLEQDLDEEFVDFLGYNPLLNSIDIRLQAEFVNEEQLTKLEEQYSKNSIVSEVVYDKPLIQLMNENIERIGIILLGGCILLALIAIGLINSSIRLSIYSKRFLIKTMQLVGANKTFIQGPFIWRSLRHGLIGGIISCGLIFLLVYYAGEKIPDLKELQNIQLTIALFTGIIITGIFISMTCTFFALKKYLKLKTDQLYF
jgi:cell division transport system permease protein